MLAARRLDSIVIGHVRSRLPERAIAVNALTATATAINASACAIERPPLPFHCVPLIGRSENEAAEFARRSLRRVFARSSVSEARRATG